MFSTVIVHDYKWKIVLFFLIFSALITSDSGQGPGAATAIVSLDAQTGSVHVNLLISGIFETDGEKNVHVLVKFEYKHNGETRSVEEDLVLAKVVNVSFFSIFRNCKQLVVFSESQKL